MVRAAVLKGKDPAQLIEEMEKIDEMGKRLTAFFFPTQNPHDIYPKCISF